VNKRWVQWLLPLLVAVATPFAAAQEDYPNRPVKLIVPFPPGGGTDILARPIAQKLAELWRQPVVIDNRGGAGGNLGTKLAAEAPADGYTLILGVLGTHAVNQSLYSNPGFDATRDFAAITMIANTPNIVVVHPSVPATTVGELIALAKKKPGSLNYATPGNGTPSHLAGAMLARAAGVELTHVPFRGGAPSLQAGLAGGGGALRSGEHTPGLPAPSTTSDAAFLL